MRIASFNINGVNARIANLLTWLNHTQPDVACLQEIKCYNTDFPRATLAAAGYRAVYCGQGPHHGVAILARDVEPIETRRALPGDSGDREARYIEAAVAGVLIGCLYLPNGNPQPGPRFEYKLAWFERLIEYAAELRAAGVPVVLAGDYNVVPTDADIYSLRSWRANALVQPAPREAFSRLLAAGWTDAVRTRRPTGPVYTFWDYKRTSFERDAGMRIDHLLLSERLAGRLIDANVDREVRAVANASDHAPVWIELADAPAGPSSAR